MKLSYQPFLRTLEEQLKLDKMVDDLRKANAKPFCSEVQHESTVKNLARDPSLDDEWIARLVNTVPDGWKARPDAKNTDEAVNKRQVDPHDVQIAETARRRPKNTLGQSLDRGVSDIKVNRAVEAFIFTPPAKVTAQEVKERAVNLTQIKSTPIKEVWRKLSWYEALIHRFKGNKIRVDSE